MEEEKIKSKYIEEDYNPVKTEINGKAAEKVKWSTNSINKALKAMEEGLPLKSNPFIGKMTKLLKPDLVRKYTEEEIEDIMHCMEDPIYFASKCYLMTPEGLQAVTLRDYQIEYIKHLQNNRFSIFLSCRQSGKSTTTAIYCLWMILFHPDKIGLILSKSGPAGKDLLSKIKDMYMFLPYHLKIGTVKWNQSEISFDNKSSISTEAFSPTAGLGKTINFLILDEFAWCPPNDVELFYNNIIPTITTMPNSNVCIMSTQNGFNKFYKLWKSAIEKKSIYAPFKVDWWQVPEFDIEKRVWYKRTEEWHQMMVGVLGSEEDFQYQYGTNFSASDKCLISRRSLAEIHASEVLFEPKKLEDYNILNPNKSLYINYVDKLYWDSNYDINGLLKDYFLVLIDLAEGGGNDSTVFHILKIIDEDTLLQVGYWKSNEVDLENSALEFWLIANQIFNHDRVLFSLEWNTYGALFYTYLRNLNEEEYKKEWSYRFDYGEEIDIYKFIKYKKGKTEDNIVNTSGKPEQAKFIPGIRWSPSNKITGCSLAKILIEKKQLIIRDIVTIGELENFEDKNGTGTYKASYGHDDLVMTLIQVPIVQQTMRWKNFIEEMREQMLLNTVVSGEMQVSGFDIYSSIGTPENNENNMFNDLYPNYSFNTQGTFDSFYPSQQDLGFYPSQNNDIGFYSSNNQMDSFYPSSNLSFSNGFNSNGW